LKQGIRLLSQTRASQPIVDELVNGVGVDCVYFGGGEWLGCGGGQRIFKLRDRARTNERARHRGVTQCPRQRELGK
jgi:hypothetical protein